MEKKEQIVREYLLNIAKETGIPIDRLMVGIIQGELRVWDYDSGRALQYQFKDVMIDGEYV